MEKTTFENTLNVLSDDIFRGSLFAGLTVYIDNGLELWFIGKEVAERLGYKVPKDAIYDNVLIDNKKEAVIDRPLGGSQKMILISEDGLYDLIQSSRMPEAKSFRRWCRLIIKNMRRNGIAYSNNVRRVFNDYSEDQLHTIICNLQNENGSLKKQFDELLRNLNTIGDEKLKLESEAKTLRLELNNRISEVERLKKDNGQYVLELNHRANMINYNRRVIDSLNQDIVQLQRQLMTTQQTLDNVRRSSIEPLPCWTHIEPKGYFDK